MKIIKVDEGIRKDESGHYIFDKEFDFDTDIIRLTDDTSGIKQIDGLTFYYGFEFNPTSNNKEQEQFRNALKYKMKDEDVFYGDEANRFVEDGLNRLDYMKRINDFGVVISTADSYADETLAGLMSTYIYEWSDREQKVILMQLFKKMTQDVTFDEEKALNALLKTEKYGELSEAIDALESLKKQFKKQKAKNEIFKIKHYKPVAGRVGFTDFLKFENKKQQRVYEKLKEGTEVLICDDFITSRATVKEVMKFLNSINPNNKLSVFVLINQYRDL